MNAEIMVNFAKERTRKVAMMESLNSSNTENEPDKVVALASKQQL